jgi:U3 small nucleolar RNA-associated protein 25
LSEEESEEEEEVKENPYSLLLQTLAAQTISNDSKKKRKRRDRDTHESKRTKAAASGDEDSDAEHEIGEPVDEAEVELAEQNSGDELEEGDGAAADDDSSATEGGDDLADPFQTHYAEPSKDFLDRIKIVDSTGWDTSKSIAKVDGEELRIATQLPKAVEAVTKRKETLTDLKVKDKLIEQFNEANGPLTPLQKELVSTVFNHQDLVFGNRTVQNQAELRSVYCLQAINIIHKTRDRVLKNSTRLAKNPNSDLELRDQGFTRMKVLILVPTRDACLRVVNQIMDIAQPEQQENKKRFIESYSLPPDSEDPISNEKPEDFKDLFHGNHDDMFRVGIKFTRKNVKYFSGFYNSDIVVASPLGLRTIIGDEG